MATPETTTAPEIHYNADEAQQYQKRSRIAQVQRELTQRCLELLEIDPEAPPQLLLDIGCGTGISGDMIDEEGHEWIGIDIAPAMLAVAQENGAMGDLILGDIGQPHNFRPGVFDNAISVSVLQWLCHSYSNSQDPRRRLRTFFTWLYNCLKRGGRAALQFYPSHDKQTEMIGKAAKDAGFSAGFVVDNPESDRKKKIFLLLSVGVPIAPGAPSSATKTYGQRGKKKREPVKHRDWVLAKKNQQRMRNMEVRPDTKYTGRKRKDGF